jgi:hypothetical protein
MEGFLLSLRALPARCSSLRPCLPGYTARLVSAGVEADRVKGGPLGLGLLIGAATFAYGYASGCRKAEILAINDDGEFPVFFRDVLLQPSVQQHFHKYITWRADCGRPSAFMVTLFTNSHV